MSIIYEALKKVEKTQGLDINVGIAEKRHSKHNFKLYLFYAASCCLGLLIAGLALSHKPSPTTLPQSIKESTPTAIPVSAGQVAKTPATAIRKEAFVLNGVFYSGDEAYCLINNQIAKVGDVVCGVTVKKIGADEVELESAGVIIRLSTHAI